MTNTKQLKITKLFRKGTQQPEDCEEIEEEIQQLEQELKQKQNDLFELQRNSYKRKCSSSSSKSKTDTFIRPEKIYLTKAVDSLKGNIELMYMLSGMEVQSYVANDHCCIVFHMQHDTNHILKHGLRIDMKSGSNEITKSSLPMGFNLSAVLEDFNNIMMPDCLSAIRKALVAYYCRLEQYEALKKVAVGETQLFKIIDGTHIEISFLAQSDMEEEDEHISVVLMLDYRVYDIRPKTYSFNENDIPEDAVEVLKAQCSVLKKKPLHKAFKEAFMEGNGRYQLSHQVGPRRKEQPRRRHMRPKPHYNNDDTFHPEHCSEPSDEEQESDN